MRQFATNIVWGIDGDEIADDIKDYMSGLDEGCWGRELGPNLDLSYDAFSTMSENEFTDYCNSLSDEKHRWFCHEFVGLPNEVEIPTNANDVANYLSDKYGYLVDSYVISDALEEIEQKMIDYLQWKFTEALTELKRFGDEDGYANKLMQRCIACKEMAEAVIERPVNLQKGGKVTVTLR